MIGIHKSQRRKVNVCADLFSESKTIKLLFPFLNTNWSQALLFLQSQKYNQSDVKP